MVKAGLAPVGLFALALLVPGCTYSLQIEEPLDRPPLVEPLPLTVGVFYTPEFRAYEHVQIVPGELWKNTWKFSLGPASVALFDQVLPSMFKKVLPVKDLASLRTNGHELDAIIKPSIEEFDLVSPPKSGMAFPVPPSVYSATIGYRITLYAPGRGDVIASWVESGSGAIQHTFVSEGFPFIFMVKGIYNDVTKKAMREAAAKLLTGLHDRPEVKRWLESTGADRVRPPH